MSTSEPTRASSGGHPAREAAAESRAAQADRDEARADRERAAAHLARAYRDDLTGALSRRPGRECLEREITRAHAARTPLTVVFADVDGLKRVNDQRGHASGDHLLHAVGAALVNNLRPYDIVIRYGGDEFVCALIDSSPDDARRTLQRVHEQIVRHHPLARLSVGYAALRAGDTLDPLLERADNDMYQRRQHQRDQSARPATTQPRVDCLHCNQPMNLEPCDAYALPNPSYAATCPTCRHSIRLSVPAPPSRFPGHETVEPRITLPNRT